MKTKIFVPSFYLASKDHLLRIDRPMIIGRSEGDFVFEEDELLSARHCMIRPQLLEAFIIDLDSKNGVFINKQKIDPNVEVKLSPGDAVQIGGQEYKFYDKEDEAKKTRPKENKRKHPRPDNLYGPENLLTFYAAPYAFRGLYLLILLGTVASLFLNLHLNIKIPAELAFLETLYNQDIAFSGVKLLFLVWLACLAHGFLLTIYFNRNPVRKGISLATFCLVIYLLVDFQHGPLGGIKRYLIDREGLEKLVVSDKAIVNLINILDHKEAMAKSFAKSKRKVREDQLALLSKDYNDVITRLDKKIANLSKKPKR